MERMLKVYRDTNILERPNLNSGIVKTIASGSSVSGISMTSSRGRDWAFVEFVLGDTKGKGYILCEGNIVALTTTVVHSNEIEIRESPNMESPVKKKCAVGSQIIVGKKVEANGGQWYEIIDDDARTTLGYVPENSPLREVAGSTESKGLLDRGPLGWILFGLIAGIFTGIIKMIIGD